MHIEDSPDDRIGSAESPPSGSISFRQYWDSLLQHWLIVVGLLLVGLVGALASVVFSPVLYDAHTTLEIQGVNESFMNLNQFNPSASNENDSASGSNLQTQIQILQSSSLRAHVMKGIKRNGMPSAEAPPTWFDRLRIRLNVTPTDPETRWRQALQMAVSNADAGIVKGTRIIEIKTVSTIPAVAAMVLNALTSDYIDDRLEARLESTQRTAKWLSGQLGEAGARLNESEERLSARKRSVNPLASRQVLDDEKAKQLEVELSQVETEEISKQSRYDTAVSVSPETLSTMVQDQTLRDQLDRLRALQAQVVDLGHTYTPQNIKVKQAQEQVQRAQEDIQRQQRAVLAGLEADLASVRKREQMLAGQYTTQLPSSGTDSTRIANLSVLEKEVEINRQTFSALLAQVNEAGLATALPTNNIRVIDPAQPAHYPFKPTASLNLTLGAIAGLLCGCLFAFVKESLNSTLREPGHSLSLLRVPELGVIPSSTIANGRLPTHMITSSNQQEPRNELAAWQQQPSTLLESFRVTLTSLMFESPSRARPRVIVISSPSSNEGKTTIAFNLAVAMAEANRRVLLVDADFRSRRLRPFFEMPNTWGLGDILEERTPVESYPAEGLGRPSRIADLWVLPTGPFRENPSNLLYSPRLPELLARLEKEFDTVIIDSPPALMFPDARVMARYANGVLLVLRSGRTDRSDALETQRVLGEDGTPILGTILNDWRPRNRSAKRYQAYQYGSASET